MDTGGQPRRGATNRSAPAAPPDARFVPPPGTAVREVLKKYWGYDDLRPLQAEAIQAGLDGRDSLVVLPTGGGKSLCYQIPAVIAGQTDVVISPLISLMKDQVDGLRACGYPAAALHGGLSPDERRQAEREVLEGRHRLVFIAPERLQNPYVLGMLERSGVRAFAIDEAHCISHWGHDFRPEYRQLATLRARFPQAGIHAFTATATQRVRDDIAAQLRLRDPVVLVGTFDRPNLVYRILPKEDVYSQVAQVLQRHARQPAIVYCLSRADTEVMTNDLRSRGFKAGHYHAGLDAATRRRTQEAFATEQIDVVVATVAFGMGIDRSDVRCVVHAAVPKSLEHYQQETGRAGRDGLEAECVLFYSYADIARWEGLIAKTAVEAGADEEAMRSRLEHLRDIQRLANGSGCRHRALSVYFGQAYTRANCAACDVCLGEVAGLADATVTAQKIISCVARVQERFGAGHVADVLRGADTERIRTLGHSRLSTFGLLKELDRKLILGLTHQLVDQGVLDRTDGEYPLLRLNAAAWEVLRGQRTVHLRQASAEVKAAQVEEDAWAGVDRNLFEALRELRQELARARNVPPFVVLHDTTLRDLARFRPTTLDGLRLIPGLGQRKLADFGDRLAAFIGDYCRQHGVACDQLADAVVMRRPREKKTPAQPNPIKQQALALFARGTPVAAVAATTGRALSTTWEYLAEFVAEQRPPNLMPWVDQATYARVADAWRQVEERRLKPIFEALQTEVPYEVIRVVTRHLEALAEQGSTAARPR